MIAYPYGAFVTGLALVIAGGLTLGRHFLLEPVNDRFPKAPLWLRNSMFGFATVLIFLGVQYLWVFVSGAPNTVPPQPPTSIQVLSIALVFYKAAMLLNIARQRLPQEVWVKLNRINEHLLCKDGHCHAMWRWLSR